MTAVVEADVPVVEVTATVVEVVVAVVEVELSVVVGAAVVGGLVVVVVTWPPHPKESSTRARRGRNTHILFTTEPPDYDAGQGSS